jgi:hypothetical protein
MSGKELATTSSNLPSRNEGARNDGTLIMEDARIIFRNFAGEEGMYNRQGDRNFCVLLEGQEELAADMLADGWNIKRLKNRETGEKGMGSPYIQVSVGFKGRPPRMVMITSRGRIDLGEEECVLIDWADILKVDLIIRPYHWNVNGKTGVKAYLKSIFVIINEDYLELKYADVPMAEVTSAKKPIMIEAGDSDDSGEYDDDPNIVDAEIVGED